MKKPSPKPLSRAQRSLSLSRVKLLFEDDEVIVVEKPCGLLTVATATERTRTLYAVLFDYVKRKRPPEKVFIVHRLDRDASGLLVFAKTESGKHHLQQQFKSHSAARKYVAVVEGRLRRDRETIQSFLAENAAHRAYSVSDSRKGKLAVTHLRVLKRSSQTTLIEVRLESGRKHQIRVHLAEHGHPVLGDKTYGSRMNPIRRLALHACSLSLKHPRTGQPLQFESSCPGLFLAQV
jgi:23S rRNA pseudouridine1911/1915/1917 synthase